MREVPDWELVARAREGDPAAFEELVQRYHVPVVHFCRRMLGSTEDAEDVAQEAFVRLYRHLARLRVGAKFSTVLFGIARNLTLNFIRDARRRGRGRTQSLTQEEGREVNLEAAGATPDRAAHLQEIESRVMSAMDHLSPKLREVLVLREVQGLEYDAIARIVRCRKGTVKSRIARGREQLRAYLADLGGEEQ